MSEASAPFNPQDQSESVEPSSSIWDELLAEEMEGANAPIKTSPSLSELDVSQIFDASALDELDDVIFEDSEALVSPTPAESVTEPALVSSTPPIPPAPVSSNLSTIAAWSQDRASQTEIPTEVPTEVPNLTELISLIQELNQCNGVLMDRVSQLEEALEYSQNALQAEVGRTQEVQTAYNAQDWTSVQEQITSLFNQLEFAHQTNQRQQILIETLTGQVENSQERVAQLEREAALIQQHYNEQSQQLAKSEGTCRDLQARLQRQQRYTLQFKAALEKCLEVPTPQYETGAIAPEVPVELSNSPFLPKAQRIQPWSAHAYGSAQSSWMKLQHLDIPAEEEPAVGEESDSRESTVTQIPKTPVSGQTTHLNLPSFGLPLLQVSLPGEENVPVPQIPARDLSEQVQRLTGDPILRQQLDEAVKPLADMLAEALLADQPSGSIGDTAVQSVQSNNTEATADELLASVMADAEDALWQDLARLIDVSTEDVVKASLSGDLAAFESLDFTALQSAQPSPKAEAAETENVVSPIVPLDKAKSVVTPTAPNFDQPTEDAVTEGAVTKGAVTESAVTVAPLLRRLSQASVQNPEPVDTQSPPLEDLIPALATSSWPSPVVYPLRPTKKRQSLAMVDLPTFPRS